MAIEHHARAVGLLEAARLICERAVSEPQRCRVSGDKLHRIASLLTAFATVYICDDAGCPLRALPTSELSGAAVAADGALVYSDGRPALRNACVLEDSIGELAERLARLGVLRRLAG